jgi:hypothetical protein
MKPKEGKKFPVQKCYVDTSHTNVGRPCLRHMAGGIRRQVKMYQSLPRQ